MDGQWRHTAHVKSPFDATIRLPWLLALMLEATSCRHADTPTAGPATKAGAAARARRGLAR